MRWRRVEIDAGTGREEDDIGKYACDGHDKFTRDDISIADRSGRGIILITLTMSATLIAAIMARIILLNGDDLYIF
jgi:hypothetical protein